MGASHFTPTTEQVREACILGHYSLPSVKQRAELGADFDRWLKQVKAEAKAEALTEAADAAEAGIYADMYADGTWPIRRTFLNVGHKSRVRVTSWLRNRARQIAGDAR